MNKFLSRLVKRTVLRDKGENDTTEKSYSNYTTAKAYRVLLVTAKRNFKDVVLITLGIFSACFGFKGFLLTNHFIDGGATGISLLISALTNIPLHWLIIAINTPFIFLAWNVIGSRFAIKTALAIVGLAICLAYVEFPDITDDNILVAVFGGFFLGTGIGFAVRGGAVIDGTEVLALYLSRKFGTTIGDIILLINIFIFLAAAYFLGVNVALYSMITYLAASKALDFIVEGIEEYMGVTMISPHSEEIKQMVITKLRRGVTVYKGKSGYGRTGEVKEIDIIYTVITRLEINKLNVELEKIDPNTFVVMNSVKDTKGGMIKRRPLKH